MGNSSCWSGVLNTPAGTSEGITARLHQHLPGTALAMDACVHDDDQVMMTFISEYGPLF